MMVQVLRFLNLDGFDTHAAQGEVDDGLHADHLKEINDIVVKIL